MKSFWILIAAALVFLSPPAAMADGFAGEANGAYASQVWGGELGASYRIESHDFHLTPTFGVFLYRGDNHRYYMDPLGNGQTRCRDSNTGRFAKTSLCSNLAGAAYGRMELTYALPEVEFGGGVRIDSLSEKAQPYGTVGISVMPNTALKANAGKDYYAVGLVFNF